jgi:N-acetylglucosamine-6-phosphate deacetylase
MRTALVNGRVLIGDRFVTGRTVVLDGGMIASIEDDAAVAGELARRDLGGKLLLPGFIDIQVNGGGGVLFNDACSVEGIASIGRVHRRFGTTGFLPTLISDDLASVPAAIEATSAAIAAGAPGVLGLHIEGPFLNATRKGIHDATKFRRLDDAALDSLTRLRGGRTVVTLAPEKTTPAMIERLAGSGIIVAAGHTNGRYATIRRALDHGMTGFTHLFNAMSPLTSRAPGVVGAALEDQDSWCSIIVDGRHVDPVVLRIALKAKRWDRFILITDAMPSVGWQGDAFTLQGRTIRVADGVCIDEDGTLAGSNLDMASAVRNAVSMLAIDLAQAVRMASEVPAAFLGLSDQLGRIAPGYRANLVLADEDLTVRETWIDGRTADEPSHARPAQAASTRSYR